MCVRVFQSVARLHVLPPRPNPQPGDVAQAPVRPTFTKAKSSDTSADVLAKDVTPAAIETELKKFNKEHNYEVVDDGTKKGEMGESATLNRGKMKEVDPERVSERWSDVGKKASFRKK
ncbi:hypothetical protein HDU85_005194 [Gaertneriomyces sp. JEL0708]|nr:hypothetical protein HDU85_005194 [Gaertneriomyces sp. JEL0708]